jgi:hypothetical protein
MFDAKKRYKMIINTVKPVINTNSKGKTLAPPLSTAPSTARVAAPMLRMRGRTPILSLSNIMTHNSTPCRSCGH